MDYNYYSNSIMHHGIKGQRWGVRRYQNEDGTSKLTNRKNKNENANENATQKFTVKKKKIKKLITSGLSIAGITAATVAAGKAFADIAEVSGLSLELARTAVDSLEDLATF